MTHPSARGDQSVWEAACAKLLRGWIAGGASVWLPLHGHSIAPFLPAGSKILVSKTAAPHIGLHWEIAHYTRFDGIVRVDHAGLWRRALPLTVGRTHGLTLCPEDMLLHLALHLTLGSEFGRLIWFSDIDAVLRRFAGEVNWERLLEEATRWRLRTILAYTLLVARDSFGSPLPSAVVPRLLPGRLRQAALDSIMEARRPWSLGGRPDDIKGYLAETPLMDRVRDIFRVLRKSLFPCRSWLEFHYSLTSWWQVSLHRILHPLRACYLAVKHLH